MGSSVDRLADLKDEAHTDTATTSVGAMKNRAEDSADPTILAEPKFKDHENDHVHRGTRDQYEEVLHHYDNHQYDKDHINELGKPPAAPFSSMPVDPRPKDELNMSANCQTSGANTKRAGSAPPAIDLESHEPKLVIERFRVAQAVTSPALKAKRHTSISTPQPENTGSAPEKAPVDIAAIIPAPANTFEEDSDEPTILSVKRVTPELKRKASNTSSSGPMQKRSKQAKEAETDDEEASPVPKRKLSNSSNAASTEKGSSHGKTADTGDEPETPCPKRPTAKQSTAVNKTATSTGKKGASTFKRSDKDKEECEQSENEDAIDDEDAEHASEDEDDEEQNLQVVRDLAKANKDFGKACRTCKINANKVLKARHDAEVSQLKKQKRDEVRQAKAEADRVLKAAKLKAERTRSALQQKYELQSQELKDQRDTKIAKLKESHKEAIEDSDEKYEDMKGKLETKIRKLTKERDDAETKRKDIEKTTSKELRDMTSDQKAAELKLKEERKQIVRDCLEQVNELKPEHSSALKAKQKNIDEMAQKVIRLEAELRQAGTDLREVSADGHADKIRYETSKAEAEKWREQVEVVEDNLREFEAYVTHVEGRCKSNIARAQGDCDQQVGIARANLQEANNRLTEQQRRNRNLNETLIVQTQLGREKDARIQALESELARTRAEIGIVGDMEDLPDPQNLTVRSLNTS